MVFKAGVDSRLTAKNCSAGLTPGIIEREEEVIESTFSMVGKKSVIYTNIVSSSNINTDEVISLYVGSDVLILFTHPCKKDTIRQRLKKYFIIPFVFQLLIIINSPIINRHITKVIPFSISLTVYN
ncbi:hypothetical protein [Bacteroides eggerthii]|uniref:hypothetical protein n=1 Tax=Bacteroides eggerthii TaxID=28111 RepID=UPI001B8B4257|nr:hypothetical protein [Bacteroides eggerthii]